MLPKTFIKGFHIEEEVKKMKYQPLGKTGMIVSRLALGTGGLSNLYGDFTFEEARKTVLQGLQAGINYIDSAPFYGQGLSETTLGKCLEGIPRESYYVATKIGRYERDIERMFDYSAEKTRQSLEASLKKLQLDYIDVIQIHDIEFAPSVDYLIKETLPVLLKAKKEGKVRFIGVSGYPVSKLAEFARKSQEIDMVLSYARMTLYEQELIKYKDDFKDLGVINAAVVGMGLLTEGGPQNWHPAPKEIKEACKQACHYCKEQNVDIAKLALCFAFDSFGDTVLNGMNNTEILRSSLIAVQEGLNEKEKQVQTEVMKKFFHPLPVHHWENIEINVYKNSAKLFEIEFVNSSF